MPHTRDEIAGPTPGPAGPAGPALAPAVLEPQALASLQALDPSGAGRLLERIVEAYRGSVDRLVPQLRDAMQRQDLAGVRHVAHTLKSSSASLGAVELSATCAAVEAMAREQRLEGLAPRVDVLCDQVAAVLLALDQLPRRPA